MVRHDVVARKIAVARRRLGQADEVFRRPLAELAEDEGGQDLGTFYLFLAIQECIDIAAHWVADAGWGPTDEAGEAFETLRSKGILDEDLTQGMRGAVGLRHRIAHGYTDLDPQRLHAEYTAGTAHMRRFLVAAADAIGL